MSDYDVNELKDSELEYLVPDCFAHVVAHVLIMLEGHPDFSPLKLMKDLKTLSDFWQESEKRRMRLDPTKKTDRPWNYDHRGEEESRIMSDIIHGSIMMMRGQIRGSQNTMRAGERCVLDGAKELKEYHETLWKKHASDTEKRLLEKMRMRKKK